MSPEILYVIAGIAIVVGMLGTFLPAIPGVPLVFAGMLLTAWAGDFVKVGVLTVVVLGLLTALAMLADFLASAFGTKVAGASGWAFAGAAIGAIVGIFFAPLGLIFGPFIGAVLGEAMATQHVGQAFKAGIGATLGLLFGAIAKIALAFTMLGIFVVALVF